MADIEGLGQQRHRRSAKIMKMAATCWAAFGSRRNSEQSIWRNMKPAAANGRR